eukprot:3431265-Pyramimonas_sp.AAC.1
MVSGSNSWGTSRAAPGPKAESARGDGGLLSGRGGRTMASDLAPQGGGAACDVPDCLGGPPR